MTDALREAIEALVDAAKKEDVAGARQRLEALARVPGADDDLVSKLRGAVEELAEQAEDGSVAFHAAVLDLERRSRGWPDPVSTLLAIERLADLLMAQGEAEAASRVLESAITLAEKIGDGASAAHVTRLRRYAAALRKAGHSEQAREIEAKASDLQVRYGTRERKVTIDLGLPDTPVAGDLESDVTVQVFYRTHRNFTGNANPYLAYGAARAAVHHGVATIGVPRHRDKGTLKFPAGWQQHKGVRSDECFLLKDLEPGIPAPAWIERLRRRIQNAGAENEALIFVHGYNCKFWEAMLRAGQLGADLEINGAIAAYSWPSRGAALKYDLDQNEVTRPHYEELAKMIVDIAKTGRPSRLFLIAHSMGARFMMEALKLIDASVAAGDLEISVLAAVRDIVFAAPDVDADDFRANVAGFKVIGSRVTVYSSEKDDALWWGETLRHGYVRAGRSAVAIADPRLSAVDTTIARGSDLGHGDYASSVIADVLALLWLDLPASQRTCLTQSAAPPRAFWSYLPKYAPGSGDAVALQLALTYIRRSGNAAAALAALSERLSKPRPDDDLNFLRAVEAELLAIAARIAPLSSSSLTAKQGEPRPV